MKSTPNPQIQAFTNAVIKLFDKRIVSFVVYGSALLDIDRANDLDCVLVLDSFNPGDSNNIQLAKKLSLKIDLHIQIIYFDQILADGSYYSVNTCGPFFLKVIQGGKLIYGKNVLKNITNPNKFIIRISILQKIQQYNYQLKNQFINTNDNSNFNKFIPIVRKRMMNYTLDAKWFYPHKSSELKNISNRFVALDKIISANKICAKKKIEKCIEYSEVTLFDMNKFINKTYHTPFI